MRRSLLAIFAGLFVAFVLIATLETLGHVIYPPPPGVDPTDSESRKEFMDQLPVGAIVSVLVAWGIGTFCGACVAARIAKRAALIHGGIIGALFLAMAVATMIYIPHPLWFSITAVVLIPMAALLGSCCAGVKRVEPLPVS